MNIWDDERFKCIDDLAKKSIVEYLERAFSCVMAAELIGGTMVTREFANFLIEISDEADKGE